MCSTSKNFFASILKTTVFHIFKTFKWPQSFTHLFRRHLYTKEGVSEPLGNMRSGKVLCSKFYSNSLLPHFHFASAPFLVDSLQVVVLCVVFMVLEINQNFIYTKAYESENKIKLCEA